MNFNSPEVLLLRETTHTKRIAGHLTAQLHRAGIKYSKYEPEYTLPDNSRVDIALIQPNDLNQEILTEEVTKVIEVEWAHKFYEAIGQVLTYQEMSGMAEPCIWLLDKKGIDNRLNIVKCRAVCNAHGIELIVEKVDE